MRYLEEQKSIMVENSRGRKGENKNLPCIGESILLKYEKFITGYEGRKNNNGNFRESAF